MGNHRQGHGRHRLHESILTAVKHGWTKLWRGCGGGGQPGGGGEDGGTKGSSSPPTVQVAPPPPGTKRGPSPQANLEPVEGAKRWHRSGPADVNE